MTVQTFFFNVSDQNIGERIAEFLILCWVIDYRIVLLLGVLIAPRFTVELDLQYGC